KNPFYYRTFHRGVCLLTRALPEPGEFIDSDDIDRKTKQAVISAWQLSCRKDRLTGSERVKFPQNKL
ncbi:MAG TPA: hypothetical protein QGI39_09940, partial [Gammaproteobacteria bacterium]|nr:hypothetical protein [Gammaproteobacteria bacterium]